MRALLLGVCLAAGTGNAALAEHTRGGGVPPPNDLFENAAVVPATGTSSYTEDNLGYATESASDPEYSCRYEEPGTAFNGVWYAFTTTQAASVTVTTAGSTGAIDDTTLSILTHDGVEFTELGCNEDGGPEHAPYLSSVTLDLAAGQTYYAFVSLYNSDLAPGVVGTLAVDFSFGEPRPVPANDLFEHAIVVPATADASFTEQHISYATESAGDPDYSCAHDGFTNGYHGVWYSITPTQDSTATVSTLASSDGVDDTMLAVFTHDGVQFTQVACNDDADAENGSHLSRLSVGLVAGETYHVFVSLYDSMEVGDPGTLAVDIGFGEPPEPPAHDLVANARVIDALPYTDIEPGMALATRSSADPEHTCREAPVAQTVWYTFTAPADGSVSLDTVGSSGTLSDTVLSLLSGVAPDFDSVACDDDIDADNAVYTSRIENVRVTAGTVYTVFVSRYAEDASNAPGTLVLHFDFAADMAPSIVVDNTPIGIELAAGSTASRTLSIGNAGSADLGWSVREASSDAAVHAGALSMPATVFLDEGFDNIATLAGAGWSFINRSSPLGTTTWFQGIPYNGSYGFDAHEGAPAAWIGSDLWSTGLFQPGTISNWLITPEVPLQNGMVFTFYTRAYQFQNPDRMEVRLSGAGASTDVGGDAASVGVFGTVLAQINPALDVEGYPIEWTRITATIGGMAPGTTGRIAFRYFVTDAGSSGANGDVIGIDSVRLRGPTACETGSDQGWLSLSPNAGTTAPGDESEVSLDFDTTGLAPGIHEAQVCIDSNDNTRPNVAVPVRLTVAALPTDPLVFTPATLADGRVNVPYSVVITATSDDATMPIDFDVTDGVLPAGLSLQPDGTLQGTPTVAGTFAFTVTASDSAAVPLTGSIDYVLVIAPDESPDPVVAITPASLPRALIDTAYGVQLTASGAGTAAPYTFALATGVLPAGVTLDANGLLAGTPSQIGAFAFTVSVDDGTAAGNGGPFTGSIDYTLIVLDEFLFADDFEDVAIASFELGSSGMQRVPLPLASEIASAGDRHQPILQLQLNKRRVGIVEARCAGTTCEVRVLTRAGDATWTTGPWWVLDSDPYLLDIDVGTTLLRHVTPSSHD